MTRILITGGSGYLGHNLVRDLSGWHTLWVGTFRSVPERTGDGVVEIDITRLSSVGDALDAVNPGVVVHLAAVSRPDDCEANPERALRVNVEGTANVASAAWKRSVRLIHFSTDLVFDGARGGYREEDPVSAVNTYARSKIESERVTQEAHPGCIIIRTALNYGRGPTAHQCFLDTMMANWAAGRPMTFYRNQFRTAVPSWWVATAVDRLLALESASGIFHVGGADRLSRYEFARIAAELTGAPPDLLIEGAMPAGPGAVARGADCSLDCGKLERTIGLKAPTAREGLMWLASRGELPRLTPL
jgi:dTDP-4-dehydrorhamnose reductase